VTVAGASVPYPYGGKQRQVMVDLDPRLLQSKGLAPIDIVTPSASRTSCCRPVRQDRGVRVRRRDEREPSGRSRS